MPLPENTALPGSRPNITRPREIDEIFESNKENPLVTIISPNFNHARFIEDTILSVARQNYKNFEHLIIDGLSTDNTKEIVDKYPHVTFHSEKDSGVNDATNKGLRLAKGKYVVFLAVSDGFLDPDWLGKCVDVLENDKEVSLVWGLPQYLTEDGILGEVSFMNSWDSRFTHSNPPEKEEWFNYWINTGFHFPECNFCARKEIYQKCHIENKEDFNIEPYLEFSYLFNTYGYLSKFINTVANFGRIHSDQLGQRFVRDGIHINYGNDYNAKRQNYITKINSGHTHHFRDSESNVIGHLK